MAFTTGGPKVMFGTKCPSITSTCTMVAAALLGERDLIGKMREVRRQDGKRQLNHNATLAF